MLSSFSFFFPKMNNCSCSNVMCWWHQKENDFPP